MVNLRKFSVIGASALILALSSDLKDEHFWKNEPKVEIIREKKLEIPVAVLTYHQINNSKTRYEIPKEEFERQMQYLIEKGYKSIFIDELNTDLPERSIIITFDDVRKNFYKNAFPIIKKLNLKATIFPIVSEVCKGLISWDELKEMQRSGLVDIQSHTMTHRKLTKLTQKEIWYELSNSKLLLELHLGKKVNYLACPYGAANETVKRIAKACGYKGILLVNGKKNKQLGFTISRIEVNGKNDEWKKILEN
jgi:peptidoglycan/xylan/chitin deacetylase (PgdA/CDA1 family)